MVIVESLVWEGFVVRFLLNVFFVGIPVIIELLRRSCVVASNFVKNSFMESLSESKLSDGVNICR